MKRFGLFCLAGLAAAVGLAQPAPAQNPSPEGPEQLQPMIGAFREVWRRSPDRPVRVTIPLHSGVVEFAMPQQFVPALRLNIPEVFSIVFLPDGESMPNFTRQLLIMSGPAPVDPGMSDAEAAETLFRPTVCIGEPLWQPLGQIDVGGPRPAYAVLSGCPRLTHFREQGQYNLVLLIRGPSDFMLLNFAVRGAPFEPGQPPIDAAGARAQIARFLPILVCRDAGPPGCAEVLAREGLRANGTR